MLHSTNRTAQHDYSTVLKTPSVGPTTETQFVSMHDAAFDCQSLSKSPGNQHNDDDSNQMTVTLSPRTNANGKNINYSFTQQQNGTMQKKWLKPQLQNKGGVGQQCHRSLTQPATNTQNSGAQSNMERSTANLVANQTHSYPNNIGIIQTQRPKVQGPVVTDRKDENLNGLVKTQRPLLIQNNSRAPMVPLEQPQIITSAESISLPTTNAMTVQPGQFRQLMPNTVTSESSLGTYLGSQRHNFNNQARAVNNTPVGDEQEALSYRSRMIKVYSPLYRGRDATGAGQQQMSQPHHWQKHSAGQGLNSSKTLSIRQVHNQKQTSKLFRELNAFDSDASLLQATNNNNSAARHIQNKNNVPMPNFGSNHSSLIALSLQSNNNLSPKNALRVGLNNQKSQAGFGAAQHVQSQQQPQQIMEHNNSEADTNIVNRRNDAPKDIKMMDTYSERDQSAFRQRLQQMQEDISRTSRLLEDHKKRQCEVARKWCLTPTSLSSHAPTTSVLNQTQEVKTNSDAANNHALDQGSTNEWNNIFNQQISAKNRMLEEMASSFLFEQGLSSVSAGRQNVGDLNSGNHDAASSQDPLHRYYQESASFLPASQSQLPDKIMQSTEISPRSQHGAPRLDFQELLNSGSGGHQQSNIRDKASFMRVHGLVTTSFENQQSQNEQDYFEKNDRPSTKRDQKITYSKTSLDELQFMEHFKKIRAIEDETTPPMPMSVSMRSQRDSLSKTNTNERASDLMSTLHKNDVVVEQDSNNFSKNNNNNLRSRNQGQLQNSTVQQRAVSQGRPSNQQKLFNKTAALPPRQDSGRQAVRLQNQTLQNRLNQLNDLLANKPADATADSSSLRLPPDTSVQNSAEKAQTYLDTINQRTQDEQQYQQRIPTIPTFSQTATTPLSQTATTPFSSSNAQQDSSNNNLFQNNNAQYTNNYNQDDYFVNNTQELQMTDYQDQNNYCNDEFCDGDNNENENQMSTQGQQMNGQLLEIFSKIGIGESHLWKFRDQEVGLYDFLLLSKDDLIELGLPIALRNRIVAFQRHYANEGLSMENGALITDFNMDDIIRQFARSEATNLSILRQGYNNTQVTETGHDFSRIEPAELVSQNIYEKKGDTRQKQLKERPHTTQGFYKKKDLTQKISDDYDDQLFKAIHQQATKVPTHPFTRGSWERSMPNSLPVAHFQSAMTQMLEANGLHRANQSQTGSENNQGSPRNINRTKATEITDATKPLPLATSQTGHDDISSSRSPSCTMIDSIKHRRPSSMMNAARGFHALTSSGDYSQPFIAQQRNYHPRRDDKASINTLSTNQVAVSRSSVTMGFATQNNSQQKLNATMVPAGSKKTEAVSKRQQAKQLYKELKNLIMQGALDPYSERSCETKSSMQSLLLDTIYRKVGSRGAGMNCKDSDYLIKKELKKLVRKMIGTRRRTSRDKNTTTTLGTNSRLEDTNQNQSQMTLENQNKNKNKKQRRHKSSSGKQGQYSQLLKNNRLVSGSQPDSSCGQHSKQPSCDSRKKLMSRAMDQWTLEQAAKKQFATLTSEQQAFQAQQKSAYGSQQQQTTDHNHLSSSCERMILDQTMQYRGRRSHGRKSRSSVGAIEEQKYTHDAFESTHDFAKEAADAIQGLNHDPNVGREHQPQGHQYGAPLSYANTTTVESEQCDEIGSFQQNGGVQYRDNNQQYLSSNTERGLELENYSEGYVEEPAETYETFDNQKQKEKRKKQGKSKKERQEPHGQTYSFGFVSSNAQLLTSDETRIGSSARLLKKANIINKSQIFNQFSDQRDYIEKLKQMQKDGQIGALGLGKIDLDKLQNHLSRGTHSPSAHETRCLNKQYENQTNSLKILNQHTQPTISNSGSFYQQQYTFAGGQSGQVQNNISQSTMDNRRFGNAHLRGQQPNITHDPSSMAHSTTQNTMILDHNNNQSQTLVAQDSEREQSDESQETERKSFPITKGASAKEASRRNKELLEQARYDIAQMNLKAAAFKSKLQLAKQQVSNTANSSAAKLQAKISQPFTFHGSGHRQLN